MPYDHCFLKGLNDFMHIQTRFYHNQTMNSLIDKIHDKGYAYLFFNKNQLGDQNSNVKCVTTIKVNELCTESVLLNGFDDDINELRCISKNRFINGWFNASEFGFMNRCIIDIHVQSVASQQDIRAFALNNLKSSSKAFLSGWTDRQNLYGVSGLLALSEGLRAKKYNGVQFPYDMASFIYFIIRERQLVGEVLADLLPAQGKKISAEIHSIIDMWKKVRLSLFVIYMRKQIEAISSISEQIENIKIHEINLLNQLLLILGD